MEVYFNTVSPEKCETTMKELRVDRKFSWNGEAGFIPAIYVGAEGTIVRLCLRVPIERIRTFREKWGVSDDDWSEEQAEQIERELPFGRHFEIELEADGEKLLYPWCCQKLFWSIEPEISPENFFHPGLRAQRSAAEKENHPNAGGREGRGHIGRLLCGTYVGRKAEGRSETPFVFCTAP